MQSKKQRSLLVITNLYPLPWEPGRAPFNRQQFDLLKEEFDLHILVPVAFHVWLKHRREIVNSDFLRIAPYLIIPKIGRRYYGFLMFFSLLLHSFFWIKKTRPQQVLATWAYPDAVAASLIAKILRVPFSFKIHGSDINVHGKYPSRARQIRGASYRARHIISVSSALAHEAEAIGIAPDKIRVIYNGVDHARFGVVRPTPYDRNYVLFAGNLKREKGVIELLDGFGAVAGRYPELDLVYAGAGPMHDAIVAKADALGLSLRVRMLGAISYDEIPGWMGNCRFLALPSHNEGVPNVILEAMASGKPVLATNVGGIPEIFGSSDLGILIAAGNWKNIAKAIPEMLEKEWCESAIMARARDFTWERNNAQLLEVLNSGE